MNYKIRLANKKDIKELAILKQRVWSETYRGIYNDEIIDDFDYAKAEKLFNKIIDNPNIAFYVVLSDDKIVGYMSNGTPVREFRDYEQEIGLLYLINDFQKMGIGRKLFDIAYNDIKMRGYKRFFVSCNKYNLKARNFYEKMGGVIIYIDEDNDDKMRHQVKYHYDIE